MQFNVLKMYKIYQRYIIYMIEM